MTDLLIAFVIPVLVIVISAILQTLLNCPFKVAGVVFVAAIIVALVQGGTTTLIALAWGYTLLAFIVAYIICKFFSWGCNNNSCTCCSESSTGTANSSVSSSNNNSGNNNTGNNNSGNNNTGNNNSGNNNTGNNNTGNNNGNNDNNNWNGYYCRCRR